MLVLSRKQQQEILIGENIKITVLKVKGNTVRLGIEAPRNVRVMRSELPMEKPVAPTAEVTVVFSNESEPTDSNLKLVAFPESDDNRNDSTTSTQSKLETGTRNRVSQQINDTVSFRQQLPQSLNHNRLKQIVDELTSKQ